VLLPATLSAHGSAAVFVDEAATFGVAEPGGRYCWGWNLPLSSGWRDKRPRCDSGLRATGGRPPQSGRPGSAAVPRSAG